MKNSGATLVREMKKFLKGLEHVESCIDDLIVYTKEWETYLQVLDELLRRLQQAHLAIRLTKCLFGAKSVEFLGYLVGCDCITINKENREKIRQAKCPTTKKEVRLFLGLANYYRDYFLLFAAIAAPLSYLVRKRLPERVQWDYPQKAFVVLRENLPRSPVLHLPDHAKPFVLYVHRFEMWTSCCPDASRVQCEILFHGVWQ